MVCVCKCLSCLGLINELYNEWLSLWHSILILCGHWLCVHLQIVSCGLESCCCYLLFNSSLNKLSSNKEAFHIIGDFKLLFPTKKIKKTPDDHLSLYFCNEFLM